MDHNQGHRHFPTVPPLKKVRKAQNNVSPTAILQPNEIKTMESKRDQLRRNGSLTKAKNTESKQQDRTKGSTKAEHNVRQGRKARWSKNPGGSRSNPLVDIEDGFFEANNEIQTTAPSMSPSWGQESAQSMRPPSTDHNQEHRHFPTVPPPTKVRKAQTNVSLNSYSPTEQDQNNGIQTRSTETKRQPDEGKYEFEQRDRIK